ncbi:MAG: GIY-YIG nuclease family protein [Anaerolineaceae bacterium]
MPFWVYILRCSDGSYYTGHTDDLEIRLSQHQLCDVEGCYTQSRRPVKLIFYQEFPTRDEAFAAERQIKGWSRAKKEAMIKGDWDEVSRLARSKTREK